MDVPSRLRNQPVANRSRRERIEKSMYAQLLRKYVQGGSRAIGGRLRFLGGLTFACVPSRDRTDDVTGGGAHLRRRNHFGFRAPPQRPTNEFGGIGHLIGNVDGTICAR